MKNADQKASKEVVIWGIHGGKEGVADKLFLKHDVIALGWAEIGDLAQLASDRDAFKKRLQEVCPGRKEGYYPNAGGQLFRFVHEAKTGDRVIYPSKHDRSIYIGEITGPYQYNPKPESEFPQHHSVKWLKDFPRTKFSQGALYEIGSAMSFFQVKNYADEFLAALSGQVPDTAPVKQDESISYVAADIEQNTRDFILKTLSQELKGHALADFVAHLLGTMGYRSRVSPEGPDGGIDIIAHKDELGFEPPIIKVQVKSGDGSISRESVAGLLGVLEPNDRGMFVTLSSFSKPAIVANKNKGNLRLIDGEELVSLVLQHYEQFDSKYKGMMPLKRVYVPEPLEESEG